MNFLVVKIAECFGKEVLKGAIYTAAVTGAGLIASKLVDKYFGGEGNEFVPPVVVNVVVQQDGVTVSQQTLGEEEDDDDVEEDCDGCDDSYCDCDGRVRG